jgi:hypothetical protein
MKGNTADFFQEKESVLNCHKGYFDGLAVPGLTAY